MNLSDLITAYRDEARDTAKPHFVSDATARRYANQAESEACRRARLLIDSTSELCEIEFSAGESVIELDSRIISIRRAVTSLSPRPLRKRLVRDMDDQFPGWDSSDNRSIPLVIITDYETNTVRLYPPPREGGVLRLTVAREPMKGMAAQNDEPEISRRYHDALVEWIKYRAFSASDSDLYDPKKAAQALAEFEAEFGPPVSAAEEQFSFEHYDDVGER